MKKLSFIVLVLFGATGMFAQHQVNSFFDGKGIVRLETQELSEAADTIISVFHRADDVVWSRIVYRIIDVRYKQNYQLYYPETVNNTTYKSLMYTMLSAIENGMTVYRIQEGIEPNFKDTFSLPDLPDAVKLRGDTLSTDDIDGLDALEIKKMQDTKIVLNYDSGKIKFNSYPYRQFVKNQLKFLIQEIVFFDKHYSRLYSKILAIAPLHAERTQEAYSYKDTLLVKNTFSEPGKLTTALRDQMLFWIPFDSFRPYMAQQYIMPNKNDTKRITFDDFFTEKRYTSYIVGASNIYDRMIPDYVTTREEIEREQQLIENELLNFELDLWEY